jgi:hypothetical protein
MNGDETSPVLVRQRTAELGLDEKGLNCDSAYAHVSDQESNSGDCSGFFDVSGITGPQRPKTGKCTIRCRYREVRMPCSVAVGRTYAPPYAFKAKS